KQMAGEVDNVPLGTVLAEEHHPVSRLDTGLRQAAGRLPSLRGELRSGERDPSPPRAGAHQRSILWSSTYHMFEEIAQRLHRYPPATCVIRRARHPLLGMASRISRRGGMGPSPRTNPTGACGEFAASRYRVGTGFGPPGPGRRSTLIEQGGCG